MSVGKYTLIPLFWLLLIKGAFGQCAIQIREYATNQQVNKGSNTSVTNASNATDGVASNYATLSRNFLSTGAVTQFLEFNSKELVAGTPVTIKAAFPASLLTILSHLEIQPFTNLRKVSGDWIADAAGTAVSTVTLANVVNAAGDLEITIIPKTSGGVNVGYDGVWIKLSGPLTLGESLDVFHAYIMKDAPTSVSCGAPVDVLAGVRAGAVLGGILSATGSVSDKYNAIDNDPTYSTYAEMSVGLQLLSKVYHTTIFSSSSQIGDQISMVLEKPNGSVLDLSLISGFSIQLYNGATAVGVPINSLSSFLSLSLLSSTPGDQRSHITITPVVVFDRVEIQLGGIANLSLTPGLRIYDVRTIIATPGINMDGADLNVKTLCVGNTSTLSVNNTQACTTYKWYNAATGGDLLFAGDTYTPTVANLITGANTFYVQANRNGCTETSTRKLATININPLPAISPGAVPAICRGTSSAAISYTEALNTPTKYSIVWDAPAITAGFTNVTDAILPTGSITVAVPPVAAVDTYTGSLLVKNANDCLSLAMPFSFTVDAVATRPIINLTLIP